MQKFPVKLKQSQEFHFDITATQQMDFGYCLRCGRKLKSAEAKKRGMGKICYEKLRHSGQTTLF